MTANQNKCDMMNKKLIWNNKSNPICEEIIGEVINILPSEMRTFTIS